MLKNTHTFLIVLTVAGGSQAPGSQPRMPAFSSDVVVSLRGTLFIWPGAWSTGGPVPYASFPKEALAFLFRFSSSLSIRSPVELPRYCNSLLLSGLGNSWKYLFGGEATLVKESFWQTKICCCIEFRKKFTFCVLYVTPEFNNLWCWGFPKPANLSMIYTLILLGQRTADEAPVLYTCYTRGILSCRAVKGSRPSAIWLINNSDGKVWTVDAS